MQNKVLQPLLFLFLISIQVAKAQTPPVFQWAKTAGGQYRDEGIAIAVDSAGNSYVTGNFEAGCSFGSTTIGSSGSDDVYLAKYNATGNLLWVKKGGGSYQEQATAICYKNGYIYIAGYFRSNTVTFGTITLINASVASGIDGADMYLVKYDVLGNVIWARSAGGSSTPIGNVDRCNGIAVDDADNVYVVGNYSSYSATFGSYSITNYGSNNAFLVKYDSTGTVQWAQSYGGTGFDFGSDIAISVSGDIYITGFFGSSLVAVGTTNVINATGGSSVFLIKLQQNGNVSWIRYANGTALQSPTGVITQLNGNVVISGYYESTNLTFNSQSISNSTSYSDVFIASFDSSGVCNWMQSAGSPLHDETVGMYGDNSGNIYISGYTPGQSFQAGSIITNNSNAYHSYILRYSGSGIPGALNMLGKSGSAIVFDVAGNGSNSLHVCGSFRDTSLTLGSFYFTNAGIIPGSISEYDMYVSKIDLVSGSEEMNFLAKDMVVYPNPFLNSLQLNFPETLRYGFVRITDMSGKEIYAADEVSGKSMDIKLDLQPGIYLLNVSDDNGNRFTKKIVSVSSN